RTMDARVPAAGVQERYERLTALVEETTYAENQRQTGATVEVLVAEGEGRKDAATHRLSGRARDNRLVHFAPHGTTPRPGDIVTTRVTSPAPPAPPGRARPGRPASTPPSTRPGPPRRWPERRRPRRSCSACRPAAPEEPGRSAGHVDRSSGR